MGDSFSNHYWGFVETLARDANLAVLTQGYPACLALPGIYLYDESKYTNGLYQKCHNATQRYYDLIAKKHFKYVIVGQFWEAYLDEIRKAGLYDAIWQAFAVLLPVQTVGVMGDGRTYEFVCALRAVTSVDGMTADYYPFTHDFLGETATRIINEVKAAWM